MRDDHVAAAQPATATATSLPSDSHEAPPRAITATIAAHSRGSACRSPGSTSTCWMKTSRRRRALRQQARARRLQVGAQRGGAAAHPGGRVPSFAG